MTGPPLVVDASVAIKWIVPEDDSELVSHLRRDYVLIAPQLIYAECANIVWKKWRRGELTAEEALEARQFVDSFAVRTVSMRELVPTAIEIAVDLDHAAYDCFYLALAILQDCDFVTADAKLHRKAHARLAPSDARRVVMLHSLKD